ncbi:MAG: DUF3089 domain-containing protein [Bacteroidia bacterium]|nr:DUF3089 domain-containing protein [Bacteroidia bacterium]
MHIKIAVLIFFFCSCIRPGRDIESYKIPDAPDYSKESCWAALPWIRDSADVVPRNSGLSDGQKNAKVDVFFIHPTSNFSRKCWNQDLKHRATNNRTNIGSILNQATVFNGSCAVYAPRYRQATLYSFVDLYGKRRSENKNGEKAMALAYSDVRTAFIYFLDHFSKGRPFIIASHSQGTWHARTLIGELVEKDSTLMKRLVAAYLIGGGTEWGAFSVLQPCGRASETGCFVSWNSMKWGAKDPYNGKKNLICVNPVSWEINGSATNKSHSKGGSPYKLKGIHPQHVCAGCGDGDGLLFVTKPRKGNYMKNVRNYHTADYNLFWLDIRLNVDLRVREYFLKQ